MRKTRPNFSYRALMGYEPIDSQQDRTGNNGGSMSLSSPPNTSKEVADESSSFLSLTPADFDMDFIEVPDGSIPPEQLSRLDYWINYTALGRAWAERRS